ncbi:MAG: thioredoxin domain-containing protein [bacterium]
MEKNNLALPIAIVLAGAIVAGAMFYTNKGSIKTNTPTQKKTTEALNVAPPTSTDSILGNLNADVVVIEYSDTECPFCKVFHNTMQQVMNQYGKDNKVAWIYRYMPLDSLHKKARKEAQAVECAKQQGGNDTFWKYVNEVYSRTNSNDSLPETSLSQIAKDLKLDMTKWTTCLTTDATASVVAAQEQTGVDAGVQGTPNNFLVFKKPLSDNQINNLITAFAKYPEGTIRISDDGKIVNLGGAMPYNLMSIVIDNALQAK